MITLRELSREDIPVINQWRQDPEVSDGIGAPLKHVQATAQAY